VDGRWNARHNCLIGNGADSTLVNGVNGNLVGTSGSPINALLAPLGNYGGPTQTMPPLPGSPAIDAATIIAGLTTDQRGSARNLGAAPDIGAVESGGLWVQNTNNSGTDSLRDIVIIAAGVANSKIILFIPNLSGATITVASEIVLSNNVTIDASSLPDGITMSGGNTTRILQVAFDQRASLRRLSFTGGNGAGVALNGSGGAIFTTGSSLDLVGCTFFGNTTTNGGAIANFGILTMSQCTVSSNQAGTFGGAIENLGPLTLTHCTISSNTVVGSGGGIDNFQSILTLENTIVAGNTAGSGADINNETATFVRNGANLVQGIVNVGMVTESGPAPINAAPLLAPLGNYGGPTRTMPPLPGSPAIDAAVASSFTTDQRGYPRPASAAADIGAVEGIYNAAGPGNITSISRLGNGSVRINFTNLADASFPVFATTNISEPSSNWTQIGFATESPAGSGQFPFTDTRAPNSPRRFYRVRSP
jgi:hypothetical protein